MWTARKRDVRGKIPEGHIQSVCALQRSSLSSPKKRTREATPTTSRHEDRRFDRQQWVRGRRASEADRNRQLTCCLFTWTAFAGEERRVVPIEELVVSFGGDRIR